LDAVFDATGGVPRLINQVCDHALVLAAVGGQRTIRAAGIEEAWSDLQQLPAPWHMESKPDINVVEYGRLDAPEAGPALSTAAGLAAVSGKPDPVERLNEIEHSLAAAAGEHEMVWTSTFSTSAETDDEEQFQPAGVIGPEVELVFHGPHAPFDETFIEEEIVIDRYAALETARLAKLRQAPWSRDRQIPERLAEAERRREATVAAADASHAVRELMVDPASDPVLPEYPAAVAEIQESEPDSVVPFVAAKSEPTPAVVDPSAAEGLDDRDLIVVEDDSDPTPSGPTRPTGRVRRQEYRQLFARLRRG
jgi:hypothetical protein